MGERPLILQTPSNAHNSKRTVRQGLRNVCFPGFMLFVPFLPNRPVRSLAAPLDEGEALSDEGRQLLLWDGDRGIQGAVGHEDAEDAVGFRCDGQRGGIGVVQIGRAHV